MVDRPRACVNGRTWLHACFASAPGIEQVISLTPLPLWSLSGVDCRARALPCVGPRDELRRLAPGGQYS